MTPNYKQMLTGLLFLICWPGVGSLNAQTLTYRVASFQHEGKARPSIQVQMEPPAKAVKKAWKDYLKDEYDLKLKGFGFLTNKDMLSAEEVVVEKMSEKELNFYSHFDREEGLTMLNVMASFGYDIYVDRQEYPVAFATMESMVKGFLRTYLPGYYSEEVEDQGDLVKDLERDIRDMEKTKENNTKRIEDLRKEIQNLQEDNEELTEELVESRQKLQTQQLTLTKQQEKLEAIKERLKAIN